MSLELAARINSFLAALVLVSGGYDSLLYWLFVGLIVRNAISTPATMSQLVLNFAISLCYALVGLMDIIVSRNLDETTARALDLLPEQAIGEPFALRMLASRLRWMSSDPAPSRTALLFRFV